MAKLTTIQETTKAHGHKASDFYCCLRTNPPDRAQRHLYSGP